MKYVLLAISLIIIFGASQGIYTYIQNPEPTVYNLDNISAKEIPQEKWITLTNCDFSLLDAAFFETTFGNGLADKIYIPLRSSNNDTIIALLATKNQNILDVYNLVQSQRDEQKAIVYIEEYKDQIFQEDRELTGLVRFGIDLDNKEHRKLHAINDNIVGNFIIIDYNTKPKSTLYYFLLGLGILILIFAIKRLIPNSHQNDP